MVPVSSDTTAVISLHLGISKGSACKNSHVKKNRMYLYENVITCPTTMTTVGVARSRKQRHWGRVRPAYSCGMQTTFGKHFHLIEKLSEQRIIFILCHICIDQPQPKKLSEKRIKGWVLENLLRPYLVFFIYWPDCIGSSKFLSLPPIIMGVL